MSVSGLREAQRDLKRIGRSIFKALEKALDKEAESILRVSEGEVPVDTGELKGSGDRSNAQHKKGLTFVEIGFGGPTIPQAIPVHEHPSASSPPSWSAGVVFSRGGSKYLERPMMSAVSGMARRIQIAIDDDLR